MAYIYIYIYTQTFFISLFFIKKSVKEGELDGSPATGKYAHHSIPELELLRVYHAALLSNGVMGYSFEVLEQQYITNVCYFLVFALRNQWPRYTAAQIEENNDSDGMKESVGGGRVE